MAAAGALAGGILAPIWKVLKTARSCADRQNLAEAIGPLDHRPLTKLFAKHLSSPNGCEQRTAISGISKTPTVDPASLATLVTILGDDRASAITRELAALAIGRHRHVGVREALRSIVRAQGTAMNLCEFALTALGEVGTTEDLRLLKSLRRHSVYRTVVAKRAIRKLRRRLRSNR